MFKPTAVSRNALPLILLVAFLALGLAGCSKQRANFSLKGAKKDFQRSLENESVEFFPQDVENVRGQIANVEQQMNSQNYQGALEAARVANDAAGSLLQRTLEQRAQTLRTEAQRNLQIAQQNRPGWTGPPANEELFQQIVEEERATAEALADTDYEDAIEEGLAVRRDLEALLGPLQRETREMRDDLSTLYQKFIGPEQGQEEAPEYVEDAKNMLDQIDVLIEENRNYVAAKSQIENAQGVIQEGIVTARRSRANKKLAQIEQLMTEAILEEAEVYKPDQLLQAQADHNRLQSLFSREEYLTCLTEAELLEPKLVQLIYDTKKAAATAAIDGVKAAIRALEVDKAREYLPGRLEEMDDLLADAQSEFEQELFSEAKKTSADAMTERDMIIKDYDLKAADEISGAAGQVDRASRTFDRMSEIFEVQSPATANPTEQRFEQTKEAQQVQLNSILDDAEATLAQAKVRRESQQFSKAIENARLSERKANYVVREVFHVVAHNNILQLADRLSRVQSNGGRQFASSEVAAAAALIEEARSMVREAENAADESLEQATDPEAYRPAVAKTAEANAAIETAVQQVAEAVIDKQKEAQGAIETARRNRAEVDAPGPMASAVQTLSQAADQLQDAALLDAYTKAAEAERLAHAANVRALTTQTGRALDASAEELALAEAADADRYALQEVKLARDRRATAEALFEEAAVLADPVEHAARLEEARNQARDAEQGANRARFDKIRAAQRSIVNAKDYNAWETDYQTVMDAVVNTRQALLYMEQGKYDLSHAYADKARKQAERAERVAKNTTFDRRVDEAEQNLRKAAGNGALYTAVEDVARVAARIADIRADYTPEEFDAVSIALDEVEQNLYEISSSTPEVFFGMVRAQEQVYDRLMKENAADFADETLTDADFKLHQARVDFEKGEHRLAYRSLRKAADLLGRVDMSIAERSFTNEVRLLFGKLGEEKKKIEGMATISPHMLRLLVEDRSPNFSANAVIAGAKPIDFREAVEDLYDRSRLMPYPVSMSEERRLFVETFAAARRASYDFEKFLILEHYDAKTVREILDGGTKNLAESEAAQARVSRSFEREGLQGKLGQMKEVISAGR